MAIYNWSVMLPAARITDADGKEIAEAVEVDTETGRVHRHIVNKDGSLRMRNGELMVISEIRPSPLTVEFLGIDENIAFG